MTKRDVCDRCLKVNVSDKDFAGLLVCVNPRQYDEESGVSEPRISLDISLCPECQAQVEKIVCERIMLTDTPDDVKQGTLFEAKPKAEPRKRAARTTAKGGTFPVPAETLTDPDAKTAASPLAQAIDNAQADVKAFDEGIGRPTPGPLVIDEPTEPADLDPLDLSGVEDTMFEEMEGGE